MDEDIIKAICNPTRIQIINCLSTEDKTVTELIENCGLSQSAVSQHLSKLRNVDIVGTNKKGREVYYSLKNKEFSKLSKILIKLSKKE